MATPSSSPSVPESTPPLSEMQRLANTFVAPSKTFTDLNRKPSWWAPWLIAAVLSLAYSYMVDHKVGFDQVVEKSIKASPKEAARLENLPAPEREQQLRIRTTATKGIFYSFSLFMLLSSMIIAGVLLATFNFGFGAEVTFKKALAVVFYAFLPFAVLTNLIAIASMAAPGFAAEGFNVENPTATNLAAFLDPESTSRPLYLLAAGVDIFSIWTVILLGIGFSCVSKIKRSTAIWTVAVWLIVWKLVTAGLAALG
jgi:Yip1 domain